MMERILFVGAHHDDLELAMGGTVKRWAMEGKKVFAAMLTNSQWSSPSGQMLRDKARVISDCERSAALLGFEPFHLDLSDAMNISVADAYVVKVLNLVSKTNADTLISIWGHDAHPAHRVTNAIAMAATRKVPNVLTVQLSWNCVPEAWNPNFFVDVTETLEYRIAALRCYQDEWERTGRLWEKYVRSTAALYGLKCGCEFAEAFEVIKLRI
jgi:LmbE family N-acetylglucosaminyl deacetylase